MNYVVIPATHGPGKFIVWKGKSPRLDEFLKAKKDHFYGRPNKYLHIRIQNDALVLTDSADSLKLD